MRVVVFSDCHWKGPTPINVEPELGQDIFYIGDNHEFKNIPKEKEKEYTKQYVDFLQECKNTGTNILNGNHEVSVGYERNNVDVLITKDKSTAFVHFHREVYSEKTANKWHKRKPGIGNFKLMLITAKNVGAKLVGAKKLKEKHLKICLKIAEKYNVKNVVFGHTHPKKLIIESHGGITMVNVPRGRTVLYCDVLRCSNSES